MLTGQEEIVFKELNILISNLILRKEDREGWYCILFHMSKSHMRY